MERSPEYIDRLGRSDPMSEPFHSALEKSGIDVIDLTDLRGSNALNHSKFADNPQVVQLIGEKLTRGEPANL